MLGHVQAEEHDQAPQKLAVACRRKLLESARQSEQNGIIELV